MFRTGIVVRAILNILANIPPERLLNAAGNLTQALPVIGAFAALTRPIPERRLSEFAEYIILHGLW